ncbi:MAG TPA: hypothetical protein VFV49_08610, partial [Thermoanaerobaculia bacterium]|nr:hypothetical protein [Thermoanaerobaculia bacterium]
MNASSEIEGEEVPASKLDLALVAATRPSARRIDEDLERRMLAVASIIRTLLWTLVEPPREFISFGFVLEVHRPGCSNRPIPTRPAGSRPNGWPSKAARTP